METDDRRRLMVRVPAALFAALEELRHARSKALGKRVSLRELVEALLAEAVR